MITFSLYKSHPTVALVFASNHYYHHSGAVHVIHAKHGMESAQMRGM